MLALLLTDGELDGVAATDCVTDVDGETDKLAKTEAETEDDDDTLEEAATEPDSDTEAVRDDDTDRKSVV